MAASIYSYNTLISAVLFSIVITFIGIFFSYDLLKIMGNSDEGIKLAKEYTDIIFLGSIVFLIQT